MEWSSKSLLVQFDHKTFGCINHIGYKFDILYILPCLHTPKCDYVELLFLSKPIEMKSVSEKIRTYCHKICEICLKSDSYTHFG